MDGLISGLKTGLLMMGIFALLSASAYSFGIIAPAAGALAPSFTAALMNVLPGAALGVVATALFTTVNHVLNIPSPALEFPYGVKGKEGMMVRGAEITQAPAVAMPIIHGRSAEKQHAVEQTIEHAQPSWADRVGHGHQTRIADILANGSMSDKDRAAALLAERETASTEHGRA